MQVYPLPDIKNISVQ